MNRVKLANAALAAIVMTSVGCSWDFNNPRPNERDVQIVGDSVFDLSGDIHSVLHGLSGKKYKDRSVSGAKISAIDSQLSRAENRSSLNTVIANGGANDILQGSADCDSDPLTNSCLNLIDYVGDRMIGMIYDMYKGPSDDHVWLGYHHVKSPEVEKNEAIDYVHDVVYPDMFDLSVHGGINYNGSVGSYGTFYGSSLGSFNIAVMDPRGSVQNNDLKSDGIHPTYSGSVKLGNLIWGVMVDQDMYR